MSIVLHPYRASLCLFTAGMLCQPVLHAARFEPGVGVGTEYTDNVDLAKNQPEDEVINVAYVGAHLFQEEGRLVHDSSLSFNKHFYTQDTFEDQQYYNFSTDIEWEISKDRFDWFLEDNFLQRPIDTLDNNTVDNIQDTNNFKTGFNVYLSAGSRNRFTITPEYGQYYYENQPTNNTQPSLRASWEYKMYRTLNVIFQARTRTIDYFQQDIADTRFTTASIILQGSRISSTFFINLGTTNVSRDDGTSNRGFSGRLNWIGELSSQSSVDVLLMTDLTDTSSVAAIQSGDATGSGYDIQITTDVIRNSLARAAYTREDGSLVSRLWGEYRKVDYSDNPLDRIVSNAGLQLNYPISNKFKGGVYANYDKVKQINFVRTDERRSIGSSLSYIFSRKLHGTADVKYRDKVSTENIQNYNELSVYFSLVYGFGETYRPTRLGGF